MRAHGLQEYGPKSHLQARCPQRAGVSERAPQDREITTLIGMILRDVCGVFRVCGMASSVRYIGALAKTAPQCLKAHSLGPADRAMGTGPFRVRRQTMHSLLGHPQSCAMTLIRQIWGRDEYLGNGFLSVPDHGTVLDLGANIGVFSLLALAANPSSRVIAIEPNASFLATWEANMRRNDLEPRAAVCQAFLGADTAVQRELRKTPECRDAITLSADMLVAHFHLQRIDLLKCDIEGSEFSLFADGSLLDKTSQLAIELHKQAGAWDGFHALLVKHGFVMKVIRDTGDFQILCAKRADGFRS